MFFPLRNLPSSPSFAWRNFSYPSDRPIIRWSLSNELLNPVGSD